MWPVLNAFRRGLPLASLPRFAGLGGFWPGLINPPASKAEISVNIFSRIFVFLIQFDRGLERLEVRLLTRDLDRLLPFATEIANGQVHAAANEQRNLVKFSSRFDGLPAAICFLRMPRIPPFGAGRQVNLLVTFSLFGETTRSRPY